MADPDPDAPRTCTLVTGRTDHAGLHRLPAPRRGPVRPFNHDDEHPAYDVLCGARAYWLVRDDDDYPHLTCDRDLATVIRQNLGPFGSAFVLSLEYGPRT